MHNEVFLVKFSDWQGLYINEKLVLEDHRIDLEEGMAALMRLEGSVSSFRVGYVKEKDDNLQNYLPKNLTDLKNSVKINL